MSNEGKDLFGEEYTAVSETVDKDFNLLVPVEIYGENKPERDVIYLNRSSTDSHTVSTPRNLDKKISQGDIYKEITHIDYYKENDGLFELHTIKFPLAIVLTQDCDLTSEYRQVVEGKNDNNFLLSILVAPLYDYDIINKKSHLEKLGLRITNDLGSTQLLTQNKNPRYHYLEFDKDNKDIHCKKFVIDFKHYFTVNINTLKREQDSKFILQVEPAYREHISQRFSNYLSRIGLPANEEGKTIINYKPSTKKTAVKKTPKEK
ncbi:hypothetical protein ACFL2A_00250 [Thermodesulfobacteriota bacterium]